MNTFTKGPWLIEYNNDVGPYDDFFVEWLAVGPARVYCERGEELDPVAKANAQLICAAPDLLAALEGMLEIYGVYESQMKHDSFVSAVEVECCNEARAAISRARGEK